jgi:hypothetical protein
MPFSREIPRNELELLVSDHHRNGVSGAPFDVALFNYEGGQKLGVLFQQQYHCAVLDVDGLMKGNLNIRFRGDAFEAPLRYLIKTS